MEVGAARVRGTATLTGLYYVTRASLPPSVRLNIKLSYRNAVFFLTSMQALEHSLRLLIYYSEDYAHL